MKKNITTKTMEKDYIKRKEELQLLELQLHNPDVRDDWKVILEVARRYAQVRGQVRDLFINQSV